MPKLLSFKAGTEQYNRTGHRILLIEQYIYVFGGINQFGEFVRKIIKLNCQNLQIEIVSSINSIAVCNFAAVHCKDKAYFWGGRTANAYPYSKELISFNPSNGQFRSIAQTGSIPPARECHASMLYGNRYLCIFGGMADSIVYNDFFIMDLHNFEWKQVKIMEQTTLPFSVEPRMEYLANRGFLFIGQHFDFQQRKVVYSSDIFELSINCKRWERDKFINMRVRKILVSLGMGEQRGMASICKIQLQSPYLIVLGGQTFSTQNESLPSTIQLFNLQTLQWSILPPLNPPLPTLSAIPVKHFTSEILAWQDRLFMIGGGGLNELTGLIEIIDFGWDKVQNKVCPGCREMYGLGANGYGKFNKPFSLKFQPESPSFTKQFISASLLTSLCFSSLRNPIACFGLLIDNSFNMSSTNVTIEIKNRRYSTKQSSKLKNANQRQQNSENKQNKQPQRPYLMICDNSMGFTRTEIIQSFYTFLYKTETYTHDTKFEEQLSIRKQYGYNLKMSAIRLGRRGLFITKTIQKDTFVGFFEGGFKSKGKPIEIIHYYVTNEGQLSSEYDKARINERLKDINSLDNLVILSDKLTTKICIFDLESSQLDFMNEGDRILAQQGLIQNQIKFMDGGSNFFINLKLYLQTLYLQPFYGRTVNINGTKINFLNLSNLLKKEEKEGKIVRLELGKMNSFFKKASIYSFGDSYEYSFKQVLVYHQNRLIYSIDSLHTPGLCGFIEIPKEIEVDLCKTKIENLIEETRLHTFFQNLSDRAQRA